MNKIKTGVKYGYYFCNLKQGHMGFDTAEDAMWAAIDSDEFKFYKEEFTVGEGTAPFGGYTYFIYSNSDVEQFLNDNIKR